MSNGSGGKIRTHIKSLTYEPKIAAVLAGECVQTIRRGHNVKPADSILFHGWSGRPYRSKWSWRKKVTVESVSYIIAYPEGIVILRKNGDKSYHLWDSCACDFIARQDGIVPATGPALCDTLEKLNGPFSPDGSEFQIIRW